MRPHSAHCSACPPALTATTQARHDEDVWGVVAPSLALTMPPFPSDSPSKAAVTSLFCDESCTEIILALGPSTELDVSAAAFSLAWMLAVIVGGWGGGGTSGESVIDVGGMVIRVCKSTHYGHFKYGYFIIP